MCIYIGWVEEAKCRRGCFVGVIVYVESSVEPTCKSVCVEPTWSPAWSMRIYGQTRGRNVGVKSTATKIQAIDEITRGILRLQNPGGMYYPLVLCRRGNFLRLRNHAYKGPGRGFTNHAYKVGVNPRLQKEICRRVRHLPPSSPVPTHPSGRYFTYSRQERTPGWITARLGFLKRQKPRNSGTWHEREGIPESDRIYATSFQKCC